MNQESAPYFEALKAYLEERPVTFHIPAHQHGVAAPQEFRELLSTWNVSCDITEVLGLDDIHDSHAQCSEAESLVAELYGAPKTKFLVNGSSAGVQAMIWTALNPGDLVLAPRNSHRSFFSGLLQSGADLKVFDTQLHAETLTLLPPSFEEVEHAVLANRSAKALFLTSPTYHGAACLDLKKIVEYCHQKNMLVLVDEAWGAHLPFHPELPTSAVTCGADMVVQSVHKMAAGLTQSAWLHYNPKTIDEARLTKLLRHLQTSSPSALLVASMDCARRQLATVGGELWSEALRLAREARTLLNESEGLFCPRMDDESRLIFQVRGYTGHEVNEYLRRDHGIQLEMAEVHQGLALILPGQNEANVQKLVSALRSLPLRTSDSQVQRLKGPIRAWAAEPVESALTVREAFHARTTKKSWKKAVDQISAELLYCYPPGVPLLYPGQRITEKMIQYLETQRALGGSIQGGAEPETETILVVEDKR